MKHSWDFLNLTTGLEWTEYIDYYNFDGFVRFQSTFLENKEFERFICEVDNNILMLLALGKSVCIWDTTSRMVKGNASRACWQGTSWLTYVLEKAWLNKESIYAYGMHSCFKEKYSELSRPTLNRIKYYRRFLQTETIELGYECRKSLHDGKPEYYNRIVEKL